MLFSKLAESSRIKREGKKQREGALKKVHLQNKRLNRNHHNLLYNVMTFI